MAGIAQCFTTQGMEQDIGGAGEVHPPGIGQEAVVGGPITFQVVLEHFD